MLIVIIDPNNNEDLKKVLQQQGQIYALSAKVQQDWGQQQYLYHSYDNKWKYCT